MERSRLCLVGLFALAVAVPARAAAAAEPTVEQCLAANEQSIALRKEHRLLASREQARVCAARGCPEVVRAACEERERLVVEATPRIGFEIVDGAGRARADVTVTMDGKAFAVGADPVPVDPGEHGFTFAAPGVSAVERALAFREGDRPRRERVVLGAVPASPAPTEGKPPPAPDASAGSSGTGQRIAAAGVAGLGVVGVVVGAVFGFRAISLNDDSLKDCRVPNEPNVCGATGKGQRDDALTASYVSTGAFIVGGAGLAGGALLWFLAPRGARVRARVGPGTIGLGGVW